MRSKSLSSITIHATKIFSRFKKTSIQTVIDKIIIFQTRHIKPKITAVTNRPTATKATIVIRARPPANSAAKSFLIPDWRSLIYSIFMDFSTRHTLTHLRRSFSTRFFTRRIQSFHNTYLQAVFFRIKNNAYKNDFNKYLPVFNFSAPAQPVFFGISICIIEQTQINFNLINNFAFNQRVLVKIKSR